MTDADAEERKIKYKGVTTFSVSPFESETLRGLLDQIENERQEGIVKIVISDREVGSLRIENRRVSILEIVDETPQEIQVIRKYPVYARISLKALTEKYMDSVADDLIEDIAFIEETKSSGENRNVDNQEFILLLWDRYWNVRTRFRGDSKDGIYLISERDIYSENDKNTFISRE